VGADPANELKGAIAVIFVSHVSLPVHYSKRDEVYFTTLLWQNNGWQNGLVLQMLFSELYTIMANRLFRRFMGSDRLNRPSWIRPWTPMVLTYHEFKTVCLSSV